MIASLILSFTDYSIIQTTHDVGWANYHTALHDPYVRTALRNTFVVHRDQRPAARRRRPVARIAACAGRSRRRLLPHRLLSAADDAERRDRHPLPAHLQRVLRRAERRHSGIIHINGPFWTTDPNWVKPGLALMISVWGVGASVVIFLAALKGVPQHLYEAAAMDGASNWRQFRDVTLPMISPSIFFVVIINTIAGLQTFDQVYTAFFNQSTPYGTSASLMYAIYIFQQAFTFFKFGYASALAWLLFVDHRRDHGDSDLREPPVRLLRGEQSDAVSRAPASARAGAALSRRAPRLAPRTVRAGAGPRRAARAGLLRAPPGRLHADLHLPVRLGAQLFAQAAKRGLRPHALIPKHVPLGRTTSTSSAGSRTALQGAVRHWFWNSLWIAVARRRSR